MRTKLVVLTLLVAACHRSPNAADLTPPPSRETVRNLPKWYLKPPKDDKYAFGTATAAGSERPIPAASE